MNKLKALVIAFTVVLTLAYGVLTVSVPQSSATDNGTSPAPTDTIVPTGTIAPTTTIDPTDTPTTTPTVTPTDTPTPTPTVSPTDTPTPTQTITPTPTGDCNNAQSNNGGNNNCNSNSQNQSQTQNNNQTVNITLAAQQVAGASTTTSLPSTGTPLSDLVFLGSMFPVGLFIRKKS